MLNSFPKYETRDLPGLKTYLGRKGKLHFRIGQILSYTFLLARKTKNLVQSRLTDIKTYNQRTDFFIAQGASER